MLMVHAGMPLVSVVLAFSFVTCSINSYCLSIKHTRCWVATTRGHACCRHHPFGWSVYLLAKAFFAVGVNTHVAVLTVGEVAPSTPEIFEGLKKKPKQTIPFLALSSLYRLLTWALMWHMLYTYNFYTESTGWQLEPNLLLLIWITVLRCSPLWAAAGWHRGNLLAPSPGSSLLLPSQSRGLCSRLCMVFLISSHKWEMGAFIRKAALCTSYWLRYRCKVELVRGCTKDEGSRRDGWLPPPPGRLWAAGMCRPHPWICLPGYFSSVQVLFRSNPLTDA